MRRFATVRVRVTVARGASWSRRRSLGRVVAGRAPSRPVDGERRDRRPAAVARHRRRRIADGDLPSSPRGARGDENLVQVVDAGRRGRRSVDEPRGDSRISTLEPGPSGYAARDQIESRQGDGAVPRRRPARRHRRGRDLHGVRRRVARTCRTEHRELIRLLAARAARTAARSSAYDLGRHRARAAPGGGDPRARSRPSGPRTSTAGCRSRRPTTRSAGSPAP